MKSLSMTALILLGAISSAQTADWYAKRFGFNANPPDLFAGQLATDYKNFGYNEGNPSARFNNTAAMMTGAGIAPSGIGRAYSDPANHLWADLYEITNALPKNTWVRVNGNLGNHFPEPFNPKGHANPARNYNAIIKSIMLRGTDLSNGLNIMWNITPGVYPGNATTDNWSNITVDPWGGRLAVPITTGSPIMRDWWRPDSKYFPYLRNHVQNFVYDVNNAASNQVRARTPSGPITENFIARMGFQMGNEPAAGHPGGSMKGQVGSWDGVGAVLEGTMAGVEYKPLPSNMAANQVPSAFGSNPLAMPSFSMFSGSTDSYRLNYIQGQLHNVQWAGSSSPGLNEIASYSKEMNGKSWPAMCGRRSLHFNSPILRWKFNPSSQYSSTNTDDLLVSRPFDPAAGRWETPQEYAKRWVCELEKQVDLVASLPMPGNSSIVDINECYMTNGQSAGAMLEGAKYANGSSINYTSLTFDQLRAISRSHTNDGGVLNPMQQLPPSRESLLAAVRTELYNRDTAGTLTPKLGRIYWWGGYYPNPRNESGLSWNDAQNVTGYNPWSDYRLTLSEIKAIWNLP